jgi:hypothetical protein
MDPGCVTIPVPADRTAVPDAIEMLGVPNISDPSARNLTHPVATATIAKSTTILILMSRLLLAGLDAEAHVSADFQFPYGFGSASDGPNGARRDTEIVVKTSSAV